VIKRTVKMIIIIIKIIIKIISIRPLNYKDLSDHLDKDKKSYLISTILEGIQRTIPPISFLNFIFDNDRSFYFKIFSLFYFIIIFIIIFIIL